MLLLMFTTSTLSLACTLMKYMYMSNLHLLNCIKVERAEVRLKGIQNMLSLVHKDHLISSVKYAILCGWQGLLKSPSHTR